MDFLKFALARKLLVATANSFFFLNDSLDYSTSRGIDLGSKFVLYI